MMYNKIRKLHYYRKAYLGYYFMKGGYSFGPSELGILPTMRCNLRCKMCAQWGERGYLNSEKSEDLKAQEMPFDQWKKVIDEVAQKNPSIILWGGEPFLYPEIMPLISYVKFKNLRCLTITNGTLLSSHAREIVEQKLDEIEISIDGPQNVNDRIRGKDVYNGVLESIKSLVCERKAQKSPYPKIVINTVITGDSYHSLGDIVEMGGELGVDGINFIYGWAIPAEMGRKYEKISKKLFNVEATSWRGFERDKTDIDFKKLIDVIERVKEKKAEGIDIGFFPEMPVSRIENFYNEALTLPKEQCFSLWSRADIRYNGDVVFCGDFPDYIAGNIRKDPILKIWNNEKARRFRKEIKRIGMLPICTRCCNLYHCKL